MGKVITSRTKNENYLGYLIFEIIFVGAITFIGTGLLVFNGLGRSDVRNDHKNLDDLFENPLLFALICLIPAAIGVGSVLYFRNRNYIIGYLFDDTSKQLTVQHRGILSKKINQISIPFEEIESNDFSERKIFVNQTYKGKSIRKKGEKIKLDFVTNNFIWEKQPREKLYFLEELARMNNLYNKAQDDL